MVLLFNVLKGRIEPSTYHVFGPAATGKTTIAIACAAAIASRGIPRAWLDASGGFSPRRFSDISLGTTGKDYSSLIFYKKIASPLALDHALDALAGNVAKWHCGAIVLDIVFGCIEQTIEDPTLRKILWIQACEQLARLVLLATSSKIPLLVLNTVGYKRHHHVDHALRRRGGSDYSLTKFITAIGGYLTREEDSNNLRGVIITLALPEGTPSIYYHGINFYVNIGAIVFSIIIGLFILRKKEEDLEYLRRLKIGYGVFLIFLSACRSFFIIAVWIPDSYDLFVEIGYFWGNGGLILACFVNEHYLIKKFRHLFSIVGISSLVLIILGLFGFFSHEIVLVITYITAILLLLFLCILFLYLAITASDIIRKYAIMSIIAMFLIGLGLVLDGESIVILSVKWFNNNEEMLDLFYSTPPIILVAGAALFASVSKINSTMVDFYTNKRICVVHKGPIKGKMYICSKCNAFYCVKCKEAIESIDKCCWNCKTPFTAEGQEEVATLSPIEPSEEPKIDEGKERKMKKQS